MMAGKWLVERSAAAGGAWGRIGGRPKAVRGGGPKPLGKVDAPKPLVACSNDHLRTGDGGRKIVRVEGAPEASGEW